MPVATAADKSATAARTAFIVRPPASCTTAPGRVAAAPATPRPGSPGDASALAWRPPARWATNRPRSTILTPVSPTLSRMASDALDLVLRLSFFDSLPLHVGWIIGAAACEWLDVIDNISPSAVRVTRLRHEEPLRCLASYDVTLGVPAHCLGRGIPRMRSQPCRPLLPHFAFRRHGSGGCPALRSAVDTPRLVLLVCTVPRVGGAVLALMACVA